MNGVRKLVCVIVCIAAFGVFAEGAIDCDCELIDISTNTAKTTTRSTAKKSGGVDLSDGLDAGDVIGILGNLIK